MANSGASSGGAASSGGWPKILLAKSSNVSRPDSASSPGSNAGTGVVKLMRDREDDAAVRSRFPQGSLNLISDSWEFTSDRLLLLLSENTDFTVIGVLGPPGAGKSTILNELYGFDGTTTGVLPPFPVQNEETRVMARHCTTGIELRVSAERFILLDTQPVFSASVLTDAMRPDGSSAVSVLGGDTLSAELAHELMALQLGVFLSSVCHVLLVVTEGLHDISLWRLMQTVEMLKQGIPDPSMVGPSVGSYQHHIQMPVTSSAVSDKEVLEMPQEESAEFFADTVFVHTKLRENDVSFNNIQSLEMALRSYFPSPAFRRNGAVRYSPPQFPAENQSTIIYQTPAERHDGGNEEVLSHEFSGLTKTSKPADGTSSSEEYSGQEGFQTGVNFYVLPLKSPDELVKKQHESYMSVLKQLRDQVLSVPRRPFSRPLTERDWLRNAARIWDFVKKSPVLTDYSKMLLDCGLFKR
ncbi:hypothetical protein O6H91_23G069000 [Diphasiastrum complanatum]|uniref:Uncharacterized protein n=1 Tax=Diphasiastrum complanatum TaxID=34168 RepID=A0ACC2ABU2_DIPCM|nr:hypothetical protein O6H91_23G069000 [Diphasiastrum complanatum]